MRRRGDISMSKHRIILKEIAEEVNYSINTVSRALRDCVDISDRTKKLIREKAIELGYYIEKKPLYTRIKNRPLIAFVYNNFFDYYFVKMSDILLKHFEDKYEFVFIFRQIKKEKIGLDDLKFLINNEVEIIISYINFEKDVLNFVELYGLSVVLIGSNSHFLKCNCIYCDERKKINLAANYFLKQRIHKVYYILDSDLLKAKEMKDLFNKKYLKKALGTSVEYIDLNHLEDQLNENTLHSKDGILCSSSASVEKIKKLKNMKNNLIFTVNDNFECADFNLVSVTLNYEEVAEEICNIVYKLLEGKKDIYHKIIYDVYIKE